MFNKLGYMRGKCAEGIFVLCYNLFDFLMLDRRCRGRGYSGCSVLLCLPVILLFLWLGMVFRRLFVRVFFVILCRPELPFVPMLKFLLDFNSISIISTK